MYIYVDKNNSDYKQWILHCDYSAHSIFGLITRDGVIRKNVKQQCVRPETSSDSSRFGLLLWRESSSVDCTIYYIYIRRTLQGSKRTEPRYFYYHYLKIKNVFQLKRHAAVPIYQYTGIRQALGSCRICLPEILYYLWPQRENLATMNGHGPRGVFRPLITT